MPIITLTTDFGLGSGYVGMMKGVILGIAPDVQIVDLSHDIPAQNVLAAAMLLARCAPFFPTGAIHLAVVDPGVGGARRPLLVATDSLICVGPDNGLFTAALKLPSARAWELDRARFWLSPLSFTFHGRDLFAPVAARLACGMKPDELGSPIDDPTILQMPQAERTRESSIVGHVVEVDRFGNLRTDIPASWLSEGARWLGRVAGVPIPGPNRSYDSVAAGELVMLEGSDHYLEIALRDGNAAAQLGVGIGEELELELAPA